MSRKKRGSWREDPNIAEWTLPLRSMEVTILLQDEAEDEHPPIFYAYLEPEEDVDGDVKAMSLDLRSAGTVSDAKLRAMKGFRKKLAKAVEELDRLIVEFPVQETMDS